ncbi:hypothetical protein COE51_01135 [Bacillus pseudomycoides]|nr:hypothetical protein COE51_01135 [Bacillus pseudomycoides]
MLTVSKVTNYENVRFEQDQERPNILNIIQLDQWYNDTIIGRFNFYNKEGFLFLLNGKRKEYSRFQSLLNNFFKYNESFGWNAKVVEEAKTAGNKMIKEEKKAAEQERKELYTNKAIDFLNKVINKDETTLNGLQSIKDKTDNELIEIINNTFRNEINKELATEILNAIKEVFTVVSEVVEESNTTETKQPEVFHLYNNTFNTYNEAYNYACANSITTSMILSSKHPTMTNERLQELEKDYIFSKHKMDYESMKEYFNFIKEQQETLDQQERYYKLRDIIKRYEDKQERIQQKVEESKRKAITIDNMLKDLYSIGMDKKEYTSLTVYYLNDEKIYSWSSGIATDKMYDELTLVHDKYYKQTQLNSGII